MATLPGRGLLLSLAHEEAGKEAEGSYIIVDGATRNLPPTCSEC